MHNFAHISSSLFYFNYHRHHGIQEDFHPRRFTNEFARNKAASGEVISPLVQANLHTRFTTLRPQSLFRPYDKVFIPRSVQMIQHYGSVLLPRGGSTLIDMTCYESVMHVTQLMSQSVYDHLPSARTQNISSDGPRTLRNIVQELIGELGAKHRIHPVPYSMLDTIVRSMERLGDKTVKESTFTHYGASKPSFGSTLDTTRAWDELGYQPVVTLSDGIVRTTAWLRDHGKLHHQP